MVRVCSVMESLKTAVTEAPMVSIGSVPNQPHLLNKYQINMDLTYFLEIWILSGMPIYLASCKIDIVMDVVSATGKLC